MDKEHAHLGRYEVTDELRRDGLSVVHHAHDPLTDREVAIKTLLLPQGLPEEQTGDILAGLRHEAEAATRLSHPAIAVVYEANQGPEPEAAFLAMEFIPGSTLEELILHEGALKADWVLATADTLADALLAAHEAGVFHGNLKPANILIRESDGAPKITDFGAIRVDPLGPAAAGAALGRAAYLAPECIQGQDPDARSDLFSLALILYEALCGEHAYSGDDFASTCRAIRHEAPIPIRQRVSDLAPAVDEFLMRALSYDPEERFEDARAFQAAIREVLAEQQRFGGAGIVADLAAPSEIEEPPSLEIEDIACKEAVVEPEEATSADLRPPAVDASPAREPAREVRRPAAETPTRARSIPPWLAATGALLVLFVVVIGWKWGLDQPTAISHTIHPSLPLPPSTQVVPEATTGPTPPSAHPKAKSPAASERRTEPAPRPAASTARKTERAAAPSRKPQAPAAQAAPVEAPPVVEPAPAVATPVAPSRAAAAAESFVQLHVKSNIKSGTLILLVDGQPVYSTQLSADSKTLGRAYNKALRKAEQEFDARLTIRPGRHTVMARVVTASRTKPLEDTVHFEIEADHVQPIRIVAGRPVGRKLTIELE